MEEELGTTLFERQGKSVVLTSRGHLLKEEAQKIIEQFQTLKLRVNGSDDDLRGHYRLGASHFLASNVLANAWNSLQQTYPKLVGEVCSMSTVNVINDVISGALDFGLCFSPFKHPDLKLEEIMQGQLVIVVNNRHPILEFRGAKACKSLSDFPAVIHKANPGVDLCENHPIFDQYNISVKASFLFDSDDCAIQKITQSQAWTLIPDIVAKKYGNQVKIINLPSDWNAPYSVAAIMRRDKVRDTVLSKLEELLV